MLTIALCDKENIISEFRESKFYEGWSGFEFDQISKKKNENNYQIYGTSIHHLLSKKNFKDSKLYKN